MPRERDIAWSRTTDPFHPFAAEVDGQSWVLYLGEFPEEPLYTLLVDGEPVQSFDDWPPRWSRPRLS